MSLQHVIRRGDSLWALAGRHLGNPARWRELHAYHNDQVARTGGNRGRIFLIQNPDVIFVGQILLLPIRDKHLLSKTKDTRGGELAKKIAIPIELQVEYNIGNGNKPIIYDRETGGHKVISELSGKITIEIISSYRHEHHLDLLMCKDIAHCKNKLNELYTPVINALLAEPELVFDKHKVVVTFPLAAKADIKPYAVHLSSGANGNLAGNLQPPPITGVIELDGRKFRYNAEIAMGVDVQLSKSDSGNRNPPAQQGFFSAVGHGLAQVGSGLYNTFGDKEFQRRVGDGFVRAGKVAVLANAAVVIKATALYSVATTPAAMLPMTINNIGMAVIDGYPPIPPSTAPGVTVAIVSMAVEWALSSPPWKK